MAFFDYGNIVIRLNMNKIEIKPVDVRYIRVYANTDAK